MITQIKKQISECEKEIERIKTKDFPYYAKLRGENITELLNTRIRHKRIEISTLQSCLKLAEETKEKLKGEFSFMFLGSELYKIQKQIEKTFGGEK
jgi:hypothetical protein